MTDNKIADKTHTHHNQGGSGVHLNWNASSVSALSGCEVGFTSNICAYI